MSQSKTTLPHAFMTAQSCIMILTLPTAPSIMFKQMYIGHPCAAALPLCSFRQRFSRIGSFKSEYENYASYSQQYQIIQIQWTFKGV